MMARRLRANRPPSGGGSVPLPPISEGLIGFWPCLDGSGTVVADHSGNGNDAVFTGDDSASIVWTNHLGEDCLYLPALGGLHVPDTALLNNLQQLTLSIRFNTVGVDGGFMSDGGVSGSTLPRVWMCCTANDFCFRWARSGTALEGPNTGRVVTDGAWRTGVGGMDLLDTGNSRPSKAAIFNTIYSDTTFTATNNTFDTGWTFGLLMGSAATGGGPKDYEGYIRDIRLYDHLLTEQQMLDINNGVG